MKFIFEISNDWEGNIFQCEADDMVGAVIAASDFVEKINEALGSLIDEEFPAFTIRAMEERTFLRADEEGLNSFVEDIKFRVH